MDQPPSSAAITPARITATQRIGFTLALAVGSRAIHLRDLACGRVPRRRTLAADPTFTSLTIQSGRNRLDAFFATPADHSARSSVLICHGIGEVVQQWAQIQRLLAAQGVSSLVFDYSGYGRSSGWPTSAQLEDNALAAFHRLTQLTPGPVSLLGFSLGTGIVPTVLNRIPTQTMVNRVVLCAAFTSFRDAAVRVGVPGFLTSLVPPIWDSAPVLAACSQRVLLVTSTADRLFPVSMSRSLAAACSGRAQLCIVEGLRHNEPFYKPTPEYWNRIANFLTEPVNPGHAQSAASC